MNSTTINHNYYKWTIASGDYYRDYESTEGYARKLANKKRIKILSKILTYMGVTFSLLILCSFYLL